MTDPFAGANAWLQRLIDATPGMSTDAAFAMGDVAKAEVRAQLTRLSHPPRTPTPSTPGTPPAQISGDLANSIVVRSTGDGRVEVGGTAPYARIQQLGGLSGPNHATRIPERPYLDPAWDAAADEARAAAIRVVDREVFG